MSPHQRRREALARSMVKHKLSALLVTSLPNVRYLTGFTGSNAMLLVEQERARLYTDARYDLQAHDEVDCAVSIVKQRATHKGVLPRLRKLREVGVESDHVSMSLEATLGKAAKLKATSGLVEDLRMVKDDQEIAKIRESIRINSAAFEAALGRYRPGMRECDLAAEIDYRQRKLGAEGTAFETIVASGERSAYPHARPTRAAIERRALLLIDMGALHEGYASDMTRVVFTGAPPRKAKQLYRAVLDAQLAAISAIRPGIPAAAVDAGARDVLKSRQLDELFTHSTGHGVGLEIHEGPSLRKRVRTRLRAGMTITVEPGVYQPGTGGIRIEDIVLVTESGCEVLTPTPKELTSIE